MTIKNINGTFFHVINSQGRVIGFATTTELAYAKAAAFIRKKKGQNT